MKTHGPAPYLAVNRYQESGMLLISVVDCMPLSAAETTALSGANDDVVIPPGAEKVDWEVELAVVIGRRASHVPAQTALVHAAGYCLHNDYSERSYQLERGGQWVKDKSCGTFSPLGPELVSASEIDPQKLRLWLKVNGSIMQDSNTSDFIFGVPFLISYISEFMTLLPGDVISTGTPPGVGLGFKPPCYLKSGDVVESGIDGLGSLKKKNWLFGDFHSALNGVPAVVESDANDF